MREQKDQQQAHQQEEQRQQAKMERYQQDSKQFHPKIPILRNSWRAFWIGGLICLLGQALQDIYMKFFDFNQDTASNPTVATLIFISVLLTGLGVYDKLGQYAGAGSAVPVTGFANSVASAAMEHRSEGLVLGVGGNMFKLAGSVIVFGVVAAFVIALLRQIINL